MQNERRSHHQRLLRFSREADRNKWRLALSQDEERNQPAGLGIGPRVTNGGHPHVEYDKAGLRNLHSYALNEDSDNRALDTRACKTNSFELKRRSRDWSIGYHINFTLFLVEISHAGGMTGCRGRREVETFD